MSESDSVSYPHALAIRITVRQSIVHCLQERSGFNSKRVAPVSSYAVHAIFGYPGFPVNGYLPQRHRVHRVGVRYHYKLFAQRLQLALSLVGRRLSGNFPLTPYYSPVRRHMCPVRSYTSKAQSSLGTASFFSIKNLSWVCT